ncbi:glycosyltransferase, partial [Enterococcus faecium]|nr:glycosyltransferase [Enterococcus faecium]
MCEISIIVPIYNVEQYLRKCVDSILAQTFTDFEVILVDDGSPDNSGAICDEYAKLDSRVRVIHKENGGLSDARNAGIEIAKGKYLGFVDSDDFIDKDMYEIL